MSGQIAQDIGGSEEPKNSANENTPLMIEEDDEYLPRIDLTWKNLCFTVFKDGESIPILKNASGLAKPGEILAVMGTSGSGKTTMINLLAGQYFPKEQISGEVKVNGKDINAIEYNKVSAYVMQDDILLPTLTPREFLRFSLDMKTTWSDEKKDKRVSDVLKELRIEEIGDNIIGGAFDRGISGGEKKRLCIGVELIVNPSVIFLDEPISGLDSYKAIQIIEILRHQAEKGRTVLMSIHQPSMRAFSMVDNLMLLTEGNIVYNGKAAEAVDYFGSLGYVCDSNIMPPDHFMNVLFTQNRNKKTEQEEKTLKTLLDAYKQEEPEVINRPLEITMEEPSGSKKARYLFIRTAKSSGRNINMTFLKAVQTIFLTVLVDMLFFDLEHDATSDQNINGALFLVSVSQVMVSFQNSVLAFQLDRSVVFKEKNQGLYNVLVYYICKTLVEFPFMILSSLVFSLGCYWIINLNNDSAEKFLIFCKFYLVSVVLICQFAGISFGYLSSSLFRTLQYAVLSAPLILGFLILFGGFLTSPESQPEWSSWIKYLSPFYYTYSILAINEYTDCDEEVCRTRPLDDLGLEDIDMWELYCQVLALCLVIRIAAYYVLAYKKK